MNLFMTVFVALLFVALTPGVLVSLPPGGSKLTVALFHGVVFALVYHLTHKAVWRMAGAGDAARDPAPASPAELDAALRRAGLPPFRSGGVVGARRARPMEAFRSR